MDAAAKSLHCQGASHCAMTKTVPWLERTFQSHWFDWNAVVLRRDLELCWSRWYYYSRSHDDRAETKKGGSSSSSETVDPRKVRTPPQW